MTTDDPIFPDIVAPAVRRCAVCGERAAYGFGSLGEPVQPVEAWYCATHQDEGDRRWAGRYGRSGAS